MYHGLDDYVMVVLDFFFPPAKNFLKHVDVKYRIATESVRNREVRVCYIPTNLNFADIMTKTLVSKKHKERVDLNEDIISRSKNLVSKKHKKRVDFFTCTYDIFIQTAGIRDGVSQCSLILYGFYDTLDTSDVTGHEVIIKIDTSNL
jgi:hypothetical protein